MFAKLYVVNNLFLVKVSSCFSTKTEGLCTVYSLKPQGYYVAVKTGDDYKLVSKKMRVNTKLYETKVGDLFAAGVEPLAFTISKNKISLNDIIEIENICNDKSINEEIELNK